MSIKYCVPPKFEEHVGKVTEALLPLVTKERVQKMRGVLSQRSRKVCAVFERTHHAHNVSAILRTMDSFGFLDVFFVYDDPNMRFRPYDAIDRSASKWLMIRTENSVEACAKKLKVNGYKIALISRPDFSKTSDYYESGLLSFSTAQINNQKFTNLVQNQDIALVFGTELYGVSKEWKPYADFYLSVDMFGFCESLNVSVCAAIVLDALREVLTQNQLLITLSKSEQNLLLEHWLAKDTEHSYKFISAKFPQLFDWYMNVRAGKFYRI